MMAALNCILHPHHVSLMRDPYTVQSLMHSFQDRIDPYYGLDGGRSHKGLDAPRFNVCETETAYLLDGEFPGVTDSSLITVEWLHNQVLIIEGVTKPASPKMATEPVQQNHNGLERSPKHGEELRTLESVQLEVMKEKPVVNYPRQLLNERRIGGFQRSFTFPSEVDAENMKAGLSNGLLRIVVPKKVGSTINSKVINIQ